MIRLEEGKFYRTRDGRKVGPMRSDGSFREPALIEVDGDGRGWSTTGRAIGINHSHEEDLIAEWADGPVRTVTRTVTERVIERGEYDLVAVEDSCGKSVTVRLHASMTSDQLRAAAAVMLELAGALDA